MYLSDVYIENFRIFGSAAANRHLQLSLNRGLNVIVGENDSGKSAILDAIRLVLATRAQDSQRLTDDDFHIDGLTRASTIVVRCTFRDLDSAEHSRFLEWLSLEGDQPILVVTTQALRRDPAPPGLRRVVISTRTGLNGEGPVLEGDARDFLQATYLRPLRDAEAELSAGKNSRLSQILEAHPDFKTQYLDDSAADVTVAPTTLVGIMRQAERRVQRSAIVRDTESELNDMYLRPLSLGLAPLRSTIAIARDSELRTILEKLELFLAPDAPELPRTRRGLGLNNVLFMAAELLPMRREAAPGFSLLLIEEPEAHLHPQLQLRLMEFLEGRSRNGEPQGPKPTEQEGSVEPGAQSPPQAAVQIILTTHSPNLASQADIETMLMMCKAQAFSLAPAATVMDASDYGFLRRFLDVTKANLFFARGVVVVEGDAENLLLPIVARKLGRPFSKFGVSIVNVGSRALFRYARIMQRRDGSTMPVRVACMADMDLVPSHVGYAGGDKKDGTSANSQVEADSVEDRIAKLTSRDGGAVRTFVSKAWTLEYDLALCGLAEEVWIAICLARRVQKSAEALSPGLRAEIEIKAREEYATLRGGQASIEGVAAEVYRPLYSGSVSKAVAAEQLGELLLRDGRTTEHFRAVLPNYIADAIDYVTQ